MIRSKTVYYALVSQKKGKILTFIKLGFTLQLHLNLSTTILTCISTPPPTSILTFLKKALIA